jgi:hypothetical protein
MLKTKAGSLSLNTSSFVTYAQAYELTLIVKKDTRKAMITLEIDVGSIPAPIIKVQVESQFYIYWEGEQREIFYGASST